MKGGRKGKALEPRGLFLLFGILMIMGAVYFGKLDTKPEYKLEVKHVDTGEVIIDVPVREGESFQINYTHSVDGLPVREIFHAEKGELVLDQVNWMSFGAGLGYMGQGELRMENQWLIIDRMNRRVGKVLLRVGTIADHRLVYRGEEYPLKNYVEGMDLVQLSITYE